MGRARRARRWAAAATSCPCPRPVERPRPRGEGRRGLGGVPAPHSPSLANLWCSALNGHPRGASYTPQNGCRTCELRATSWKTRLEDVGNSVYGKLAQGLDGSKKSFNPATGRNERVGPSKYHRAGLGGLYHRPCARRAGRAAARPTARARRPQRYHRRAADERQGGRALPGRPLTRVFVEAGNILRPGEPAVEVKHEDDQVLVWRTRGHVGVGSRGVQAQGGIQLNGEPAARRAELHKLFRERCPARRWRRRHFDSLRSLVTETGTCRR